MRGGLGQEADLAAEVGQGDRMRGMGRRSVGEGHRTLFCTNEPAPNPLHVAVESNGFFHTTTRASKPPRALPGLRHTTRMRVSLPRPLTFRRPIEAQGPKSAGYSPALPALLGLGISRPPIGCEIPLDPPHS